MKSEFITLYEELDNLNEANMSANDYANYTDKSLVRYEIFWPSAWADSDKTRYENSGITFRQAVAEIIEIISKLPTRKKFGITIHCEFIDVTNLGAEAFYLYTFKKEYKNPATLRFNTRSITPAPDFVRTAGQRILDMLEASNFIIEEDIELRAPKTKITNNYKDEPVVFIWSKYVDETKKDTWLSVEKNSEGKYEGMLYETAEEAVKEASAMLVDQLEDDWFSDEELPTRNIEDWTVEAIAVPLSEVSEEALCDNDLIHLLPESLNESATVGCGLEEVIDIMEKYNRLPYLPSRWKIDDIDDRADVSSISFINKGLQLMFWFYVKEEKDIYTISYNAGMSDIDFNHKAHTMSNLSPEDCIKFIFGVVEEFDKILDYARNKDVPGYKKALKAAGYKVSRI